MVFAVTRVAPSDKPQMYFDYKEGPGFSEVPGIPDGQGEKGICILEVGIHYLKTKCIFLV